MVEQWNGVGRTVEQCGGTVEQWNSVGGTVKQGWWNSGTVLVD